MERLLSVNVKKRPNLKEIINFSWVKRVYSTLPKKYSLLQQVDYRENLKKSVSIPIKRESAKIPLEKIEDGENHAREIPGNIYKKIERQNSAKSKQAFQIHDFLNEDFESEESSCTFLYPNQQRKDVVEEEEKEGVDVVEEIPREFLYCYPSDSAADDLLPSTKNNVKVLRVKAKSEVTLSNS